MSKPSANTERPRDRHSAGCESRQGQGCAFLLEQGCRTYMIDPALDRSHQPLKVTAQHRQTSRVQQQPPAAPLPRACGTRCARGRSRTASVSAAARGGGAVSIMRRGAGATGGQSDLLVLAKDVKLGLGETELRIRYRGREGRWHRRGSLHVAWVLRLGVGLHFVVERSGGGLRETVRYVDRVCWYCYMVLGSQMGRSIGRRECKTRRVIQSFGL